VIPLPRRRQADPAAANELPASGAARSTVRLRQASGTFARESSAEPGVTAGQARNGVLARAGTEETAAAAPATTTASPTTDAARLATMTGGSLVAGADGRASVVFAAGRPTGRPAHATRSATLQRSVSEAAPAPAPIDVDDLYEQIAARLRRELLLDRERAGELP
jgi:hypothetical protein